MIMLYKIIQHVIIFTASFIFHIRVGRCIILNRDCRTPNACTFSYHCELFSLRPWRSLADFRTHDAACPRLLVCVLLLPMSLLAVADPAPRSRSPSSSSSLCDAIPPSVPCLCSLSTQSSHDVVLSLSLSALDPDARGRLRTDADVPPLPVVAMRFQRGTLKVEVE